MKKYLLMLLIVLTFAACSSDQEKKNDSESKTGAEETLFSEADEVAAAVSKDDSFDLSYNFSANQTAIYKLTGVSITNQQIESADSTIVNEVNQTSEYNFELTTKSVTEDLITLDLTIKSIKINANFNGEIVEFDSELNNDTETLRKFSQYASLPNQSFKISINKQGQIEKITEFDGVVNKYIEIQLTNAIDDEQKKQLTDQLREQALKPLVQQLFKYTPEEEIKLDSTWTLSYPSEMGLFKLQNNATSTLAKIIEQEDHLVAKIDTKLDVDISGDGNFTRGDVEYNFNPPVINGRATTYFDLDLGIIKKSETSTETEMVMTVTASNPNVGSETAKRIDYTVNKNSLELIEVK